MGSTVTLIAVSRRQDGRRERRRAVEVSTVDGDGTTRVLRTMSAGETFGEIGLLTDQPRTASVTATSDAELLRIDAATFREVMQRSQATRSQLEVVAATRFAT